MAPTRNKLRSTIGILSIDHFGEAASIIESTSAAESAYASTTVTPYSPIGTM